MTTKRKSKATPSSGGKENAFRVDELPLENRAAARSMEHASLAVRYKPPTLRELANLSAILASKMDIEENSPQIAVAMAMKIWKYAGDCLYEEYFDNLSQEELAREKEREAAIQKSAMTELKTAGLDGQWIRANHISWEVLANKLFHDLEDAGSRNESLTALVKKSLPYTSIELYERDGFEPGVVWRLINSWAMSKRGKRGAESRRNKRRSR